MNCACWGWILKYIEGPMNHSKLSSGISFLVFILKLTPKTKPPPEIWNAGCSQYSSPYARYVLFSVPMEFLRCLNSLPKWLWPLHWSSPVSQSQAIPEEAGEGRETFRTGERITHGWAVWRLNPNETLDLTRFDRLTDRVNELKVQVSNSLNRSALQHSAASGRHIQHQTRPAFLQEKTYDMWIV